VPAEITVFEDRSFTFVLKTPPATDQIRKAVGLAKGSNNPARASVGSLSRDQLRQIAELKMKDLNATTVEAAEKIIEGSARSMGVKVE
jgi:large subunit ribosomal protein L11